ncbi:MAG: helix-turn-helix domain-containing protein [Pseudomonadota bacterium]
MHESSSELIDEVVSRREAITAGQLLVKAGEPLEQIIAVRSGALKVSLDLEGEEEQIIGFVLPGELMGLEALTGERYPYVVEVLEPGSICRFNLSQLDRLEGRKGEFQQQLILALGHQARSWQSVPLLMGAKNAERRVALFLLGISSRLVAHGFPGQRFKLPMSRYCIANYLGLAMETVSRVLKRFQARGLVEVSARRICLSNLEQLRTIAGIQW